MRAKKVPVIRVTIENLVQDATCHNLQHLSGEIFIDPRLEAVLQLRPDTYTSDPND